MNGQEKFSKVGPYILMETIGSGSFGKVKICVHQDTHARYACKIIEKSLVRDRMYNQQVQREIAIMSRLRHPNTVSLVSVHSTTSKVFIIMELVTGGELFDEILRHRRLLEARARFYFRQLIDGLQYCHAHGIYHRDLKPDNLLLDPNGTLKITDFGLATLKAGAATDGTDSVTGSLNLHTQCGTPNYVAPEVINIDPGGYSGSKVDAWGCGIILYVLVSGALPFDSENLEDLFKAIVRCDLDYPDFFSDSLKDLISNLLETNPKYRYSLAEVEQHPWYNEPEDPPSQALAAQAQSTRFSNGTPQELPIHPTIPLPEESQQRANGKLLDTSSVSGGTTNLGHTKDSKDSLDFGTRVSMASGLTMSAFPSGFPFTSSMAPTDPSVETKEVGAGTKGNMRDLDAIPADADDDDVGNIGHTRETTNDSAGSETHIYGPNQSWVLTDTDRMVWCRMMKDFDMIPDTLEFDLDSATLCQIWENGLAREQLRKKSSFAAGRFGVPKNARSRSAQYLSYVSLRSHRGACRSPSKTDSKGPDHQVVATEKSASTRSAMGAEEIIKSEERGLSDIMHKRNDQDVMGPISAKEVHVNDAHNAQDTRDGSYELLDPGTDPKSAFLKSCEEHVPAGHPSTNIEVSNNDTVMPPPDRKMGMGRDLLEENESVDLSGVAEHTKKEENLETPVTPKSESRGFASGLKHNRNIGTKVTSALSSVTSATRGKFSHKHMGQDTEGEAVSPFAYDVPGPKLPLPVAKNILGAVVPSTVSSRRLLGKSSTPLDIKNSTQFHSLMDPSVCFEVVQSVLRDYGCSIIKTSSARSREKHQLRCESKRNDGTVHARISIHKIEDGLCTVLFKRLHHTDAKDFMRFYSEISRLYSENLKRRELTDKSTRKERKSKREARVRFDNDYGDETPGDNSL